MLINALAISVVVMGLHLALNELIYTCIGQPEDIFLSMKKWQQHLSKPLWYCATCMASFWGTMVYLYFGGNLVDYVPTILAVALLNTLFAKLINR